MFLVFASVCFVVKCWSIANDFCWLENALQNFRKWFTPKIFVNHFPKCRSLTPPLLLFLAQHNTHTPFVSLAQHHSPSLTDLTQHHPLIADLTQQHPPSSILPNVARGVAWASRISLIKRWPTLFFFNQIFCGWVVNFLCDLLWIVVWGFISGGLRVVCGGSWVVGFCSGGSRLTSCLGF